jgi:vacuolar-type H+-ATPase subunit H
MTISGMTEATAKQGGLLEDSTFNIISQLEKKADFLYSSVEKYVRDAEKDNKPELAKMWNAIKEDEQKHLKMLREELVREAKENKLK